MRSGCLPPPKTPVKASTIVEMVIERAVTIEKIVVPCSRNKVRNLSAKDVFLSKTFSRVCLILATCVWRSFRFCDSISNLACFSVFKSSNLSLYSCLCSSESVGSFSTSSNFLVSLFMRFLISLNFECYLRVHPVFFVKPYRSLKILACQGQHFVMLPVSLHEYLKLKAKGPPGVYSPSLYPLVIHA